MDLTKWNERYAQAGYIYGEKPNAYLKENLEEMKPGKILLPADGEGRNGVYAATKGWKVFSFDISREGRRKAMRLADRSKVSIDYRVGELAELDYKAGEFDLIALIFAHFHEKERRKLHQQLAKLLKPGGTLILEAFSKNHLPYRARNPKVGGPPEPEMLYDVDGIGEDFKSLKVVSLKEEEVGLAEGQHHLGTGMVVRFVGKAK